MEHLKGLIIFALFICAIGCKTDTSTLKADQEIRIGKAELLYTADETPVKYDGSLSTIQKDENTMLFYHPWGCMGKTGSEHTWHYGPPNDPLRHLEMKKSEEEFWDYNGYYQGLAYEGIWVLGMYKRDNGDLLGITHSESRPYPGNKEDQVFAIGLGYSTDNGKSFTFCGEIVRAADPYKNVGGGAYIIRDDSIYVYYNDREIGSSTRRLCVARAHLDSVLNNAADHKVVTWHKYRNGNWNTPGLSDTAGTSVIPLEYGSEDLHSDAAYCTALDKYLLTVQASSANRLLLFSSKDGLNWAKEAVVDYAEGYMQPYSSFVDYDGPTADCREVDGEFYIFYPRSNIQERRENAMYRRLITIE